MAKTVEKHGVTFVHRKPAKPGIYLCVRVHAYDRNFLSGIETAHLSDDWTLHTGNDVIPVESWLTRGGQIRKKAEIYFTEKTLAEMNA